MGYFAVLSSGSSAIRCTDAMKVLADKNKQQQKIVETSYTENLEQNVKVEKQDEISDNIEKQD